MTAIVLPVIALTPELLTIWLGPVFSSHARLPMRILLAALIVSTGSYAAHAAVRARSRPMTLVIVYALELPVHLLVVYTMVRSFGIAGAALAWALRATLDTVVQQRLAERLFGHPIERWLSLWLPAGGGIAFVLACEVVGTSVHPAFRLAAAAALAAIVVAFLLGREGWSELRAVLFARRA
jgi:hypothetical protein